MGIICGENGRIIFSDCWCINHPSRAQPLSHLHCLVQFTDPSRCNVQSKLCSHFLNASTAGRRTTPTLFIAHLYPWPLIWVVQPDNLRVTALFLITPAKTFFVHKWHRYTLWGKGSWQFSCCWGIHCPSHTELFRQVPGYRQSPVSV